MTDLISIFIFTPIQYIGFWPTAGIYAALFLIGFHYLLMPSRHELLRMVRRQTEGKQPGDDDFGFDMTRRRVLALVLLVIGILAILPLAQVYAAMVQAGVYIPSQGGSNLVQCADLANVGCWSGGNTGAILATNSTICTSTNGLCPVTPASSCPVAMPSPCPTKMQHGFGSCTITSSVTFCQSTITFSPSYSVKPVFYAEYNSSTQPQDVVNRQVTTTVKINTTATLPFQTHNITWTIPLANTELNGGNFQRLTWASPSVFTNQQGELCADVAATAGIPTLTVQSSPDQTTWTNMGADGLQIQTGVTGFQCSPFEALSLAQGTTYYFRVMGNDPANPAATTIGSIELFMFGRSDQSQTLTIGVPLAPEVGAFSATTIQGIVRVAGLGTPTASDTITFNWWAGIPA